MGVVVLVLSLWLGGLSTIARWMGIETYPPAMLFAVGTLFVLPALLRYSTGSRSLRRSARSGRARTCQGGAALSP